MLTPCLEPLPDGTRLHRADLAVNCDSDTYFRAFNTAIVMIFVYPAGIPAICERASFPVKLVCAHILARALRLHRAVPAAQ